MKELEFLSFRQFGCGVHLSLAVFFLLAILHTQTSVYSIYWICTKGLVAVRTRRIKRNTWKSNVRKPNITKHAGVTELCRYQCQQLYITFLLCLFFPWPSVVFYVTDGRTGGGGHRSILSEPRSPHLVIPPTLATVARKSLLVLGGSNPFKMVPAFHTRGSQAVRDRPSTYRAGVSAAGPLSSRARPASCMFTSF